MVHRPRLLVVAILVGVLLGTTGLARTAAAEPDISGEWTSDATGAVSGICANVFVLHGTSLVADINCDIVGRGTLEGTIDLASGRFVLEGKPGGILLHVEGILSADGQSMEGTWEAPEFAYSGTFTGKRGKVDLVPLPPVGPSAPTPPEPLSAAPALRHGQAALAIEGAAYLNVPAAEASELELTATESKASGGNEETLAWLGGVGILGAAALGVARRISA